MKKPVIIIIVDALRADALSCMGNNLIMTPNIDKIAKDGSSFTNSFSTTNTTDPALTSIYTGKYPFSTGLINQGVLVSDKEIISARKNKFISEYFRENGYKTFGIDWIGRWHQIGFDYYYGFKKDELRPLKKFNKVFNSLKRKIKTSKTLSPVYNFLTTYFNEKNKEKPIEEAKKLTDKTIDIINKSKGNFFIFLHFWETHPPYILPENFKYRFNEKNLKISDKAEIPNKFVERKFNWLTKFGVRDIVRRYYGCVAWIDLEVGRIAEALKKKGIYDDTTIIITGDHGEGFTEHGIFFDHHGLYDTSTKVPLIIKDSRVKKGRYDFLVQNTDLFPTLLNLNGIAFDAPIEGKDIINMIKGDERAFIVLEEHHTQEKIAIRTKRFKYIHSKFPNQKCRYCNFVHSKDNELFDLKEDPLEKKNIFSEKPKVAQILKEELFSYRSNIIGINEKKNILKAIKKIK